MTSVFRSWLKSIHQILKLRWRIGKKTTKMASNSSNRWSKTNKFQNISVLSHLLLLKNHIKSFRWSRNSRLYPLRMEASHWIRKIHWSAPWKVYLLSKGQIPVLLRCLRNKSHRPKWTVKSSRTPRSRWNKRCNFSKTSRSPRIFPNFAWNLRDSCSRS